jgi:hypothetical protein
MVIVFALNRKEVQVPETLDELLKVLDKGNLKPSLDFGGIIGYGDMIFLVYRDHSVSEQAIANILRIPTEKIRKHREFEDMGKGRYLIYEGTDDKGNYVKIEVLRE